MSTEPATPKKNDPCLCGSGKKFKKCCGDDPTLSLEENIERKYNEIRKAEGKLVPKILRLAARFGEEDLEDVMFTFSCGMDGSAVDDEMQRNPSFMQMLIFWILSEWPVFERDETGEELALADLIALDREKNAFMLKHDERLLVNACKGSRISWYVVQNVREGLEVSVKDFFTGETTTVREHEAAMTLQAGDTILARIVSLFGVNAFFGLYPRVISPRHMDKLLILADSISDAVQQLRAENTEFSEEFTLQQVRRTGFFGLADTIAGVATRGPELQNTDGDPMELLEVTFTLHVGEAEAIRALEPLITEADQGTVADLDEELEQRKPGEPLHFAWCKAGNAVHQTWETTLMAHFNLLPGGMTVHVNSRKRAELVRERIESLLGSGATFETIAPATSDPHPQSELSQEEFMALPEVQEKVKEMASKHWESWLNTPIPALGNVSPREATKTARGRQLLEALLISIERDASTKGNELFAPDMVFLRTALGFTDAH